MRGARRVQARPLARVAAARAARPRGGTTTSKCALETRPQPSPRAVDLEHQMSHARTSRSAWVHCKRTHMGSAIGSFVNDAEGKFKYIMEDEMVCNHLTGDESQICRFGV